jgi:divalent metal cation (Fe/Co/Zn/Cd) transporter
MSQTPQVILTGALSTGRTHDLKLALQLTWVTIIWMTIEGAASLILGHDSGSLLLEAFGIDSVLELVSAFVLLWRLRVELGGDSDLARIQTVERRASKIVGYTLYVLVGLIVCTSSYKLFFSHAATDTRESVWGIAIGIIAKVGMPLLAGWKLKLASRLNSRALRADAMEAITCGYLSVVLIIGLGATWLLGWWWLDSVAALALIPFLIKEGREAIAGECCTACCS